jgi:hypothetical protein
MWQKPYGKTGKKISVIGFGAMRFANPENINANAEVVLHAYERGINYFDTAPEYCKDKSEEIVGAALRQMKPGTFYVSTKCMAAKGDELRASLERSLKRLGVDCIHFFHIWCLLKPGDLDARIAGGAVAAALKAKDEGLIEHLVTSSHLAGRELKRVLERGLFEGVTLGYSAINFPYREEAVKAAASLGLGLVTMNPLGGGLIPANAERFAFLRGRKDPSVVAAALRFNVSHPAVTSALVGFTTKAHVDQAVEAVEGFKPYDRARIARMRERILDSFEGLCTGCGYCLPCPEGVEIPKMMDAYNMRLLEGSDPKHVVNRLKWHWGIEAADAKACALCGECEDRCTQHLPIGERLKEIAGLAEAKPPKT